MADNFVPVKRPRPGDGEEELLRMQEEFNEKKFSPCAKVINLRAQKSQDAAPVKKQSKFAKARQAEADKRRISTSQSSGNVTREDLENLEKKKESEKKIDTMHNYTELLNTSVLGNIIEKKVNIKEFKPETEKKVEETSKTGFPTVFASQEVLQDVDAKESLFMRTISKQYNEKSTSNFPESFPKRSRVIFGAMAEEIHKENIEKLKGMSEDEILAEKKNLESMLDPSLLDFIKSMKDAKNKSKNKILGICESSSELVNNMEVDQVLPSTSKQCSNDVIPKTDSCDMEIDSKDFEIGKELPEPVVGIVKDAEKKGWVHMDDIEPEKVKWMEDLPQNQTNIQSVEEPYNARFDFQGTLLPFNDENLTVDKGLHHHGEEPERPGYSLQELLQLSRSAAQQQRCTALATLANILEKTHLGWYDRAVQPSILETLNQKNILLLLRFSLDDTALPVIVAALQALRAFIFCETDEVCLDKLFGVEGFDEPVLKPSMQDVDDIESLKDDVLAQYDTVATAMRSDIVLRIRFILNEVQLPLAGMTAALEILARLARHSRETALSIANTPNLLDIIVNKCIPLSMNQPVQDRDSSKPYGCPLVAAIRLGRILITYAGRPVVEKLNNLKIIHSLLSYISSDANHQQVRLHIESLRLWRLFLHYGVETDSVVGARLTLVGQLRLMACTLDVSDTPAPLKCDYATSLIAIAKYDEELKEHVTMLLAKWSVQLARITTPTWHHAVLVAEAMKTLDGVAFLTRTFQKKPGMFSFLSSSSNLLSNLEPAVDRDPSSLPSLGVMTFEGKLQPIMDQHSKIVFFRTVLHYFLQHGCNEDIEKIFSNKNFKNYLKRLKNTDWSLERSWFTRIEYSLLVTIIKIENQLKIADKLELGDTIWKIAIKLISALPADCPTDVRDILVFSLGPERVSLRLLESELRELGLSDEFRNLETVENPELAGQLYEKFVSQQGLWSEAAMPKDWLYLPLVDAYSRMRQTSSWHYSQTCDILRLLKLELVMPELTQSLPLNLRFSRLLLLYLCDDVFLHPPNNELVRKLFSELVKTNYEKLDLAGSVPGLNSFTDLFTALCENFAAHSYGDSGFVQALLVFVAQRYDVHYRRLLWSEHAAVIRYCGLGPEDFYLPYEHEYLYPLETDVSLIEAYITALVRENVRVEQSPGLYYIALHHAAMYLKESNKLATVMRSRIEKLLGNQKTERIARSLLDYTPAPRLAEPAA